MVRRKRIALIGFAVLTPVSIIMFIRAFADLAQKSNEAISKVGQVYTKEGEAETIYGRHIEYYNQDIFDRRLQSSNKRIFSGYDLNGERILCMVIDAQYPMRGGKTSSIMVAAMPISYLETVLALSDDETGMYSFIIRREPKGGGYVRCHDCGMNEHVAKPIDVDRLTQILKKYLKKIICSTGCERSIIVR